MLTQNITDIAGQILSQDSSIIEFLPGCVYWKDTEGRYLGCNRRQANKLGFTSMESIVGKTDFDLPILEHLVKKMVNNDKIVMQQQKPLYFYEDSIDYLGTPELYLTQKAPLFDPKGTVQGIIGVSFLIEKAQQSKLAVLTLREKQCLYYLAHGRTAREIGDFLGISARTVEDHIALMKRKLNVKKKSELIDIYYRDNFILF